MTLRIRSTVLVPVLLSALAGCATTKNADRAAPVEVGAQATQSVAAGPGKASGAGSGDRSKVTATDYEAAVSRLAACLKESGITLINDGWDPVDNERMILRYDAPGMSEDEVGRTTQRCKSVHLAPVAAKYDQDNKSRMAPKLMAAVQACLDSKRIEHTGREENPQDLLDAVPENKGDELRACVRDSVHTLYPKLFSTAFP